jgi:hypothetical protein
MIVVQVKSPLAAPDGISQFLPRPGKQTFDEHIAADLETRRS